MGEITPGSLGPIYGAGAPSAGTSEVQSLEFTGTPTGGTFKLLFEGILTASIAYSTNTTTCAAAIQAALVAHPSIGSGGCTVAIISGTTYGVTFAGNLAVMDVSLLSFPTASNGLTGGTAPSCTVAVVTPGVKATCRGLAKGGRYVDTSTGEGYVNQGTSLIPVMYSEVTSEEQTAANVIYWDGVSATLQSVITAITDATSSKPYTIIIPPGRFDVGALACKPWVNLKGAGGRGRMTVFVGTGATSLTLDGTGIAGTSRFRMDGIRFETCPVTFVKPDAGTLVVTMDDCPCNSNSPVHTHGATYGSATTMINIEFSNLNLDHNTITQTFQLSRVTFRNCTLLGLYFQDSDAYFFGCDISSGCNFVNSATSAGGWFEFAGCKIDTMVLNDPTSESVLATAFASDNENVQIHNVFHGATAPGSINYWGRIQPGALYYCNSDSKLYVKTGAVGTNTWGAQT